MNRPSRRKCKLAQQPWPGDRPSIDQLQRRYGYNDADVLARGGRTDDHRVYVGPPQLEHLNFPEWYKADGYLPPDPSEGMIHTSRNHVYREINFDSWKEAGYAMHVLLEKPSQPYNPATNKNAWERYFGYQAARDYMDRVAGWTEQHELGHFNMDVVEGGNYPRVNWALTTA